MCKIELPFKPPMEDLKMELVASNGVKCYIFDTCCKNFTPEEKERVDRAVMTIYYEAAKAEMLEREEEPVCKKRA